MWAARKAWPLELRRAAGGGDTARPAGGRNKNLIEQLIQPARICGSSTPIPAITGR